MKRVINSHWPEFPHSPTPQFWISHLSLRHESPLLSSELSDETESKLADNFKEARIANVANMMIHIDPDEPIIGFGLQVEVPSREPRQAFREAFDISTWTVLNSLVSLDVKPESLMYDDSFLASRAVVLGSIPAGHPPDVRQAAYQVDPEYGHPTFRAARDELTDFTLGLAGLDDIVSFMQKESHSD